MIFVFNISSKYVYLEIINLDVNQAFDFPKYWLILTDDLKILS